MDPCMPIRDDVAFEKEKKKKIKNQGNKKHSSRNIF